MEQIIADRRDIDFVLYEQLESDKLTSYKKFSGFNRKVFDMIVTEARNLAVREILPTNHEGDKQGVVLDKGKVTVPPSFHKPYRLLAEGAWTSMTAPTEWGGLGLPETMQVYGGYGYTAEYPVEQLLRDCRITSIYEGTDGIQSMDLLGRKMTMKKGLLFRRFIDEVKKTIAQADSDANLCKLGQRLSKALDRLNHVGQSLAAIVASPRSKTAYANSFLFLDVTGDVIMAWMLLWRAVVANKALASNSRKKDVDFYSGVIKTAEYHIKTLLPVALGKMEAMENPVTAALDIPDTCFWG